MIGIHRMSKSNGRRSGVGGAHKTAPDPELVERSQRRTFTAELITARKVIEARETSPRFWSSCSSPGGRRRREYRAMIEQTVEDLTPFRTQDFEFLLVLIIRVAPDL